MGVKGEKNRCGVAARKKVAASPFFCESFIQIN